MPQSFTDKGIISGWNLSWGEGRPLKRLGNESYYIRLESELG